MKRSTFPLRPWSLLQALPYPLILCLFFFVQCAPTKPVADSPPQSAIGQSNFIFYGEVIKTGASNLSIPVSGNSAIVKVIEVIDAPAPFNNMKEREITVLFSPDRKNSPGDKQVFYTTGWHYGKTMGVKEVPNNLDKEMVAGLKDRIDQERIRISNDSLTDELRKASFVIQGVVVDIRNIDKREPFMDSEHDPEYKLALIEIKMVLKGKISEKTIMVYFSSSDDVMWDRSPKLKKGQEGIFLLQSKQAPPSFPVQGYTVLDRRDVQQVESRLKIDDLLKK